MDLGSIISRIAGAGHGAVTTAAARALVAGVLNAVEAAVPRLPVSRCETKHWAKMSPLPPTKILAKTEIRSILSTDRNLGFLLSGGRARRRLGARAITGNGPNLGEGISLLELPLTLSF